MMRSEHAVRMSHVECRTMIHAVHFIIEFFTNHLMNLCSRSCESLLKILRISIQDLKNMYPKSNPRSWHKIKRLSYS